MFFGNLGNYVYTQVFTESNSKPLEFLAKTTMKAHPYPWPAHEDPDVGDYSCDPGDGMPVRPCEHALILFHVG